MKAAQECASCHLLGDVGYAGMCRLGGGNIIEREANASDDLRDEDEQQAGPEDIGQPRATGDWLVERLLHQLVQAGASIEPSEDALRKGPAPRDAGGYSFLFVHRFIPHLSQLIFSWLGTLERKYSKWT